MDRRAFFPRALMAIDAATVTVAFVLSYYLRRFVPSVGLRPLGPIDHYLWILLATIPIWRLLLFMSGAYRPRVESPASIVRTALKVVGGVRRDCKRRLFHTRYFLHRLSRPRRSPLYPAGI